MAAVQFFGIKNVTRELLEADAPLVKVFQGKQFIYGASTDDTISLLERMAEGGTDAVYTVRFCNEDEQECGSFNFKLTDAGSAYGMNRVGYLPQAVEQRLAALEKEGKGASDEGIIGKIGEYVENNPWVQQILMSFVGKYLKLPGLDSMQTASVAESLAGVSEDDDRRISAAVEKLKSRVPNGRLGELLSKLAAMDETIFQMLIAQLDKM